MSFLTDLANEIKTNPDAGKDPGKQPIPAGRYTALINKAEEEPYLYGSYKEADFIAAKIADPSLVPGSQLSVEFEILEGDQAGRKVWDRLVFAAASNHPDFPKKNGKGKFTAENLVSMNQDFIRALFKRAAVPPENIEKEGFSSLLNRTMVLDLKVEMDKKGINRNKVDYMIRDDIGKPAETNSARPRVDDESVPF